MKKIISAWLVLSLFLSAAFGCTGEQPTPSSLSADSQTISTVTDAPTKQSSLSPIQSSKEPPSQPSKESSSQPSKEPSSQPPKEPSSQPSKESSSQPPKEPSAQASKEPSSQPSKESSSQPPKEPSSQASTVQSSDIAALSEPVQESPSNIPQPAVTEPPESSAEPSSAEQPVSHAPVSTPQPVPVSPEADASGFVVLTDVVPEVILDIRYYSTYNFVGERIDGYEQPTALVTREAAAALKKVSDEMMKQGYRLKIYDAYRPQSAVSHFDRWAQDPDDTRMKEDFYPELDKSVLIPEGYISARSGHSRGSTIDLTLCDFRTGEDLDMGGTFDYFGELSHPDYTGITEQQYRNRMLLREAMTSNGFKPLYSEWWHFTLLNEPYPDTYFTFPVSERSVR